MTLSIKRENFKGRYFIVVRDKGRFASLKRWSPKFPIRKAAGKFKRDKTLLKDISKRKLKSGFTEVTDVSEKPKIKRDIPFRVIVTGLLKDGTIISASSQARIWGSRQEAKEAALTNFWERVAQHFNQEYDADAGMQFEDKVRSIKFRTIKVIP